MVLLFCHATSYSQDPTQRDLVRPETALPIPAGTDSEKKMENGAGGNEETASRKESSRDTFESLDEELKKALGTTGEEGAGENKVQQREVASESGSSLQQDGGEYDLLGDAEFGEAVIVKTSNWYPWTFDTSFGVFGTTNAELVDTGAESDSYILSSTALNYNPGVKGNLFADIGFIEETYRYSDLTDLDFDYFHTHAGGFYYLSPDEPCVPPILAHGFVFANYSYYRISDGLFGPEAFSNHSIVFGYQKSIPVKKGHQLYIGTAADLSIDASDSDFRRNEFRFYTGYSVDWTEDVSCRLGYVASLFDYTDTSQTDWNHSVELSGTWILARPVVCNQEGKIYVETSAVYDVNCSNTADQDYRYFNFGGGVGFRMNY